MHKGNSFLVKKFPALGNLSIGFIVILALVMNNPSVVPACTWHYHPYCHYRYCCYALFRSSFKSCCKDVCYVSSGYGVGGSIQRSVTIRDLASAAAELQVGSFLSTVSTVISVLTTSRSRRYLLFSLLD